jgi:uncharacterized LabA/DUF88 family protein
MSTAVFVDVPNLFHSCKKKYSARLDYQRLYDEIVAEHGPIHKAVAYGLNVAEEADKFKSCLKIIGFQCQWRQLQKIRGTDNFKKAEVGVAIAMDVVRHASRVDTVVLVSGDANLVPAVEWLKEQGVKCLVYGVRISTELKAAADRWIEIPEDMVILDEVAVQPE